MFQWKYLLFQWIIPQLNLGETTGYHILSVSIADPKPAYGVNVPNSENTGTKVVLFDDQDVTIGPHLSISGSLNPLQPP